MTDDQPGTVEQRLRAAVDSSPGGLLMADASGRIVLVNREVERLFGYSREELLGQAVELLVPERLRGAHAAFRAGFLADPRARRMGVGRDLYGRRKDGSEIPLEIGLTPVGTEEGVFVLATIVDISARKRAEARFRVAVEASPNGMVMVDAEGRIVLVNRAVERMFDYRRDELLGQSVEILVPERSRRSHIGDRRHFSAAPRQRQMGEGRDLFGRRKDGAEFPVEIGLSPIETEEGTFVLSSIVDISARRQLELEQLELEEQLRQAQKMEAVGTLAGGVAHDFRNILNGIMGYAELLREQLSATPAAADLDQLVRFTERGKQLVDRILTFSRRAESRPEPIRLGAALDEAVSLLRAALPATVEIRTEIGEAPRILADATAVQQVVVNLGTNAAQAMPAGGAIEVRLESFYVRDSFARANPQLREGDYAVLSVLDTGVGMDAAVRARVFEPFFTTKEPGVGTGLGLAVVHGIMKDHHGAVLLESEPGRGTTVRCFFPALPGSEPETAAADAAIPRGHGERVLYVDDEPALARLGARRLILLGYDAAAVTSGDEALARIRDDPAAFDLVITDYTMPGMNGLQLARELTGIRPGLPIIMTTGFIDEFPPSAMAEAGVQRLAMKPVGLDELGRLVAELVRR